MIFKSSEIRWFLMNRDLAWDFYLELPEEGEGRREPDRVDYYLSADAPHTGIKIREGNHELKVKRGENEDLDYGVMEHWIKWSTSEEKNILNTVDQKLLTDWVAVKKKRFKKTYQIVDKNSIEPISEGYVDEGCGAEFTEIRINGSEESVYTFGMEAFSSTNCESENLHLVIDLLDLDFSSFRKEDSFGYPEFLKKWSRSSDT